MHPPPRLTSGLEAWIRGTACMLLLACVVGSASGALPVNLACPQLLSPAAGEVMDNGRSDGLDDVVWEFSWLPCGGAEAYQLTVDLRAPTIRSTGWVDVETVATEYTFTREHHFGNGMLEGWSWRVRARVGGEWGPWPEERGFSVEPPDSDPITGFGEPGDCPLPLEPEAGAVLDNGRADLFDEMVWSFAWTSCPGASAYWLAVLRDGEPAAVISDRPIRANRHEVVGISYIPEPNLEGWSWRVRAKVDGEWKPWSIATAFSVEPPGSDPPRADLMTPAPITPVEGETLPNAGTYPDMHMDDPWWFYWGHVPSAAGYQLVVTAPHLGEPFLERTFDEAWVAAWCVRSREDLRGACSLYLGPGDTPLPAGFGDWSWQARAWLGTGWGPWSESAAFTIGPEPGGAEAWVEGRLEGWTAGPAQLAGWFSRDMPPLGDGTLAGDGTFRLHLPAMALGEYSFELPSGDVPGRLIAFPMLEVFQVDSGASEFAVLATSFEAGLMPWREPSDHVVGDVSVQWWFADRRIAYTGSWQHDYGETRVELELRHGWNMVLVQVIEVMDDNTWVVLQRTVDEPPSDVAWYWTDRERRRSRPRRGPGEKGVEHGPGRH